MKTYGIRPDEEIFECLVTARIAGGEPREAYRLFKNNSKCNSLEYDAELANVVLNSLFSAKFYDLGMELFESMKENGYNIKGANYETATVCAIKTKNLDIAMKYIYYCVDDRGHISNDVLNRVTQLVFDETNDIIRTFRLFKELVRHVKRATYDDYAIMLQLYNIHNNGDVSEVAEEMSNHGILNEDEDQVISDLANSVPLSDSSDTETQYDDMEIERLGKEDIDSFPLFEDSGSNMEDSNADYSDSAEEKYRSR